MDFLLNFLDFYGYVLSPPFQKSLLSKGNSKARGALSKLVLKRHEELFDVLQEAKPRGKKIFPAF